jgi:hypothetical protein
MVMANAYVTAATLARRPCATRNHVVTLSHFRASWPQLSFYGIVEQLLYTPSYSHYVMLRYGLFQEPYAKEEGPTEIGDELKTKNFMGVLQKETSSGTY